MFSTSPLSVYLVIGLSLLLFGAIAYLIFKQATRRRFALQTALHLLAGAALSMMALQPGWQTQDALRQVVLITPGAEASVVRAFADTADSKFEVFSLDSSPNWQKIFKQVKPLPDAAYMNRHFNGIHTLHVFGYGLHRYEWTQLKLSKILFHPTPPAAGVKNIQWQRNRKQGQPLQIQGTLAGLPEEELILYLADPGGVLDSLIFHNQKETTFSFTTLPKKAGKALYQLRAKTSAKDLIFSERLDVFVEAADILKILILQSAPTFEMKHLKNWLTANQNAVAIRSTISRQRYRYEFINQPEMALDRISKTLLENFDLVIADSRHFNQLLASERTAITEEVTQHGLGLLIFPDNDFLTEKRTRRGPSDVFHIKFRKFEDLDYRLVKLSLTTPLDKQTTLIQSLPFEIEAQWGMQAIFQDEMSRMVAGRSQQGKGALAVTLVTNSFKWILEGNASFHAAYWSQLLSAVARRDADRDIWRIIPEGPVFTNQPLVLQMFSSSEKPTTRMASTSQSPQQLALLQDRNFPSHWQGRFWPRKSGWHRAESQAGPPFWFFVHRRSSWQTYQQWQKIEDTRQAALLSQFQAEESPTQTYPRLRRLPASWFFTIFLSCMAVLWFIRKL